jgi:hypothetical protein
VDPGVLQHILGVVPGGKEFKTGCFDVKEDCGGKKDKACGSWFFIKEALHPKIGPFRPIIMDFRG